MFRTLPDEYVNVPRTCDNRITGQSYYSQPIFGKGSELI